MKKLPAGASLEEQAEYFRRLKNSKSSGQGRVLLICCALAVILAGGAWAGYSLISSFLVNRAEEAGNREAALIDATAQAQQRKNAPIVIKGLYIGMTAQEVGPAVQTKFGEGWTIPKGGDPRNIEIINPDVLVPLVSKGDYAVNVVFDGDGKAKTVYFGPNVSKLLFKSDAFNDEQFLDSVKAAYNIPEMNWTTTESGVGCWEYVSPKNVRVRVTTYKTVSLEQIGDRTALRSNFN